MACKFIIIRGAPRQHKIHSVYVCNKWTSYQQIPFPQVKLNVAKKSHYYIELCFLFWIGFLFLNLKYFTLSSSEHTIFPPNIFVPLGWGEVMHIKLLEPEEYKLLSIVSWISLQRSISGCVSGIFAPFSMVTCFASLYSFIQNNSWMGLIWTTVS